MSLKSKIILIIALIGTFFHFEAETYIATVTGIGLTSVMSLIAEYLSFYLIGINNKASQFLFLIVLNINVRSTEPFLIEQ